MDDIKLIQSEFKKRYNRELVKKNYKSFYLEKKDFDYKKKYSDSIRGCFMIVTETNVFLVKCLFEEKKDIFEIYFTYRKDERENG